ncbi:unnamed protein product, partial [Brenthis ino]
MTFCGKVVLVTGGSSGIGAATAIKFSEEKAKITIVGRNKTKLTKVAQQCEKNHQPFIIIADLTKEEEMKEIIDKTVKNYGKLDILVNNAGVVRFESILSEKALETFDKVMAINLKATVHLTHFAAPHLIKTKGCIVNISSIGSTAIMHEENFAYSTSKAALDQFSRCVALELSTQGVRVNNVNPGPVKTDCLNELIPDINEREKEWGQYAGLTPLGKLSKPEEIADIIMYLAGDKAKSITGSSFVIDNGLLLRK